VAILQAALELFYDRYTAACHAVFEDDDLQRLDALALVPRRELHHPAVEKRAGEDQTAGVEGSAAAGASEGQRSSEGGQPAAAQSGSPMPLAAQAQAGGVRA